MEENKPRNTRNARKEGGQAQEQGQRQGQEKGKRKKEKGKRKKGKGKYGTRTLSSAKNGGEKEADGFDRGL
ncbi:MAG: hypothetical protein D6679_12955 [Candidatus Hydrogenedentota bacterium]|nr:MAG: hypothetical protein D6679_12955 [Candidatus Hydrogenedentota bacterium]